MEIDLKGKINDLYNQVTQEAKSRGYRAANALRSASLEVLRGQRSGKIYRKPFTKKATYQASAPGEPRPSALAPCAGAGSLAHSPRRKTALSQFIRPYGPMLSTPRFFRRAVPKWRHAPLRNQSLRRPSRRSRLSSANPI